MTEQETNQYLKTELRFFYGYIIVVAAFFVMMLSFGLINSFGVFLNPLINEFGWSRAVTSGAFSLTMVMYGLLSIVMGALNDRLGPRKVVTICGFFLGFGYLLMSQVSAIWQLYLFLGTMTGIGIGGVWGPLLSTIARWFVKRRGLMTGIVLAGMGIGGLVIPPVLTRLIIASGLRLSYAIIGITALVVMVAGAQFLKRDPTLKGLMPYGDTGGGGKQQYFKTESIAYSLKEASHTVQFWLYSIVFFFRGFCTFAIMVHIVPHAIDMGISVTNAANVLATAGGMGVIGNVLLGGLGDRIGNKWVHIIGFILMTASLLWLLPAGELWMLLLFAAVFGLGQGGMSASASPLLASLFGLSSHGLLFGVVALGFRIGAGIGPFLAGYIFDVTSSYHMAFLACIVFSVVGLIVTLLLKPTPKLGGRI